MRDKLSRMITAGSRLSLFATPATQRNPIKHSFTTALRQMRCVWDTRVHRLGRKSAPPSGKLSCGLIGAGSFFHYAYLPALNRKASRISIAGILLRNEEKFREAQTGLHYTTRCFSSLEAIVESGVNSTLVLLPNHLHFEFVRKAVEKGLNVFCEKPLTNNVAEALYGTA